MLETQRSGREVVQPDAYIKKIVSNTFLNGRRRAALWRRHVASITIFEHDDSFEEQAIVRDELWRALHRLPRRQRTAVVLRYYEDLSFAAAAEVLDCTEATARSLVRRGLSRLRVIVKEDEVPKP
jgi:RNA polymerase sigma factor (sigma-70 family)